MAPTTKAEHRHAERISADQAREHLETGALLVCAYDSDEKFQKNHLQGAISLSDLHSRLESLAKDRELIFYCA